MRLSDDIERTSNVTGATLERWTQQARALEHDLNAARTALAAAKSMLSGHVADDAVWESLKRRLEQIEHEPTPAGR